MDKPRNTEIHGTITDVQRFSVHDGIGIRTIVFLKGCPLRCAWCHNPETNRACKEVAYYRDKCIGCAACIRSCPHRAIRPDGTVDLERCTVCGICAEVCCTQARTIIGEERTASELVEQLSRDLVFYQISGGGLTLSGGEPSAQPEFARALAEQIHEKGIGTAIETCGFCKWELLEPIIRACDIILYDIKHMDSTLHEKWTGVPNQLILDNARRIGEMGKQMIIRIPLIPGVNHDDENLAATGDFAKEIHAAEIHILPFHQLGKGKWHAMERDYSMEDLQEPNQACLDRAKMILEEVSGLPVNIGGQGV